MKTTKVAFPLFILLLHPEVCDIDIRQEQNTKNTDLVVFLIIMSGDRHLNVGKAL